MSPVEIDAHVLMCHMKYDMLFLDFQKRMLMPGRLLLISRVIRVVYYDTKYNIFVVIEKRNLYFLDYFSVL